MCKKINLSATLSKSEVIWEEIKTVLLSSWTNSNSRFKMSSLTKGSTPEVASSSKSIFGLVAKAKAKLTFTFIPLENVLIALSLGKFK